MADQAQANKPDTPPKDARSTEQRLADLELQLAQSRAGLPGGTIPDHGAGVGTEVYPTWSQWEQEQSYLGIHPDQEEEPGDPGGSPPGPAKRL